MTDQVIAGLHEDVIFVDDLDVEDEIVSELLTADMATLIEIIMRKVVYPDIPNRIPNNEEIRLRDHTRRRIDLDNIPLGIINRNNLHTLASPTFQVNLPQSYKSIITARNNIKLIIEWNMDTSRTVDGCRMDNFGTDKSFALLFVDVLAEIGGELPDADEEIGAGGYEVFLVGGVGHGVEDLTVAF